MDEQISARQQVMVITSRYKVMGNLGVYTNARLTDFMNESKGFISITDAVVTDLDDNPVFKSAFLNVRRDAVDMIMPITEMPADPYWNLAT